MNTRTSSNLVRLAAGAALSVFGASAAMADSAACGCLTAETASVAQVSDVTGSVLVSVDGGFTALKEGVVQMADARFLTGPDSSATFAVSGTCNVELPANSRLISKVEDGQTCVMTEDLYESPSAAFLDGEAKGSGSPEILLGLLGLAAAIGVVAGSSSSSP